ncbi:MAG TPA: hypothetical protein VIM69_10625 [Opitutaceae bacterium]
MNDIDKLKASWEAQDRFEVEEAYRALLKTPTGRKFLSYLLEITKFMQQPFTGSALNTAFACGEQNVGKRVLADMMEVDPEAFVTLIKERNNVHSQRNNKLAELQLGDPIFDYDRNNYTSDNDD